MKRKALVLLLLGVIACAVQAQANKLYYPKAEAHFDERTGYPLQLLRLAFSRSESLSEYDLYPGELQMPRGRSLKLVEKGLGIDVFWAISTAERQENLKEVNFDIYKGLFGYRLLFIQQNNLEKFKQLDRVKLQRNVAGLSPDWPDYQILKANGFTVQGTSSYAGLFKLLELGRVDYLPRSVFEAWSELEHFREKDMIVSPSIALYYPISFNFYFSKENAHLALDLEKALKEMQSDGSFEELFDLVWQDALRKSELDSKLILKLKYP